MENSESITKKFIKLWPYYILQSIFASVTLGFILFIIGRDNESWVAISAMSATAFIVFAMPNSVSAQTRNVLGGHLTGILCGFAVLYFPVDSYIQYTIVVGLAFFFMVALDLEHPPAAGTALAVVMNEVNLTVFMVILTVALTLTLIHRVLKGRLKDLV